MGGAAAVVDVEAVGHRADGDQFGTGPRERLRRDPGGRAVRLVEDDLQSVETVREDTDEVGDVLVEPLVVVPDAADAGAGRAVPGGAGAVVGVDGLDAVLQLVGELVAAAGEELDAVVGHGVVAGGQHHAEVGAERAGEVGHRGRRQDATRSTSTPALASPRPPRPPGTPRRHVGPGRPPRSPGARRRCPPRPVRAPRRRRGPAPARPSDPRWRRRARRPCRRVVPLVLLRKRQFRKRLPMSRPTQSAPEDSGTQRPAIDHISLRTSCAVIRPTAGINECPAAQWRAAGAFGVQPVPAGTT